MQSIRQVRNLFLHTHTHVHTPRVVAVRNYYVIKIHLKAVSVRHVHTLVEQWKKGEQPRAQLSEGELCTHMYMTKTP